MPKLARVGLTLERCERAKPKAPGDRTPTFVWDSKQPGLALRVQPSGAKSFVLRYKAPDGRYRLARIGRYDGTAASLNRARSKARKYHGQIENNIDPLREEREKRAPTVSRLCEEYEKRHLPRLKDRARPNRVITLLRERWGRRSAASITREEIAQLHSEIGEKAPYEANRTVVLIHKMWALAEMWGLVPEGHPNPSRRIEQ